MKHHNGTKRVNKVDGGKKKAKRQRHKTVREDAKKQIQEEKPVPMSNTRLFDNGSDWLDDEPWRTW